MRVIITAGGSGGHIYPAIAIAMKIKEMQPQSEILYIGTHDRMEKTIVPSYGLKYEEIKINGLNTSLKKNLQNIGLIIKAKRKCLKIMKEFKPDVVVGVGGYVTYPVIKAAAKLGIKVFLHEQNILPGKTNRILQKHVDVIGVSLEESIKYFKNPHKCILTGNPASELAVKTKAISKTKFGLNRKRKSVLMVQGSLGSTSINEKMKAFLTKIDNEDYEVLYITGKASYEEFSKNKFSKNVHIVPYVNGLSGLMKDIDVVVSRAGASTIAEMIALEKPSILIPSPYVANNHQFYNAEAIINAKAGEMIEEKDFNPELLKEKIDKLLNDEVYYQQMQKNLSKIAINDSSTRIYHILKELSKK